MFRGLKSVCWGIVVLVGSVTIAWNSYKLYRHFRPPPPPPPFNPTRNLSVTFELTTAVEVGHRPEPVPTHGWMECYSRRETNTLTIIETCTNCGISRTNIMAAKP
jgi:hypothetical protein